jgi:hypothetical protein
VLSSKNLQANAGIVLPVFKLRSNCGFENGHENKKAKITYNSRFKNEGIGKGYEKRCFSIHYNICVRCTVFQTMIAKFFIFVTE